MDNGFRDNSKIFQVSTLQALALGYSRAVINVGEMLCHGDIGLGTFEDVNGEMIVTEGRCYKADNSGIVTETPDDTGVPFAAVAFLKEDSRSELGAVGDIGQMKEFLNNRIEEEFSLNSMHIVRIDGSFGKVCARSGRGVRAHHVTLKESLSKTQKVFTFENVTGTLVCVYFPDYMDGINAPGWHLHFISDDRRSGGHVLDFSLEHGTAVFDRKTSIEIKLPHEPAFDTYALKNASQEEIRSVEQGR